MESAAPGLAVADAGRPALIYGVDMVEPGPPIEAIHAELDRAQSEFHHLITHRVQPWKRWLRRPAEMRVRAQIRLEQ